MSNHIQQNRIPRAKKQDFKCPDTGLDSAFSGIQQQVHRFLITCQRAVAELGGQPTVLKPHQANNNRAVAIVKTPGTRYPIQRFELPMPASGNLKALRSQLQIKLDKPGLELNIRVKRGRKEQTK